MRRFDRRALSLALLIGCGSSPSTPVLSDLMLDATDGLHAGDQLHMSVIYSDPDGDLSGGTAELALRRETEPRGDLYPSPLALNGSIRGLLKLDVTLGGGMLPGHWEVAVTVIDKAGRRSNSLTGMINVVQ